MPTLTPAVLQPEVLERVGTPTVAAALWDADAGSLEHVSDGASFIYRFHSRGRRLYLRLTPPGWQDRASLRGESTYIEALTRAGIAVAHPVPSSRGHLTEAVDDRGNELLAMAFEEAPGSHLPMVEWDAGRTRRFGRLLAETHAASLHELPLGQVRRHFEDEGRLTLEWLPAAEKELRSLMRDTQRWAESLPRGPEVYGLVHYDLCPDNLLWSEKGAPAVIDFDDCMFTWFAADIARTLGSLHRGDAERCRQLACWTREGYVAARDLDVVSSESLPMFVRFSAISSLAWCLYSRSCGLVLEDASTDVERHLRGVIADPEAWCW